MSIDQKRNPALDIIRIIALTGVIAVHFFLNTEFYYFIVAGKRLFLMTVLRNALMVCVPLFLILSGYLMNKKSLSKKYYYGLEKTISIYLSISIITILYRSIILKESYSFGGVIFQILGFSAAPYSWYIEMYIGLYLLIPFLNVLYNGLEGQRQKQVLILTLLFLTSLPNIVNTQQDILPNWWSIIYPLTYYFLGCYLNEFPWKCSNRLNACVFFTMVVLFGSFNFVMSHDRLYFDGPWQDWGSLPIVIMTICVFSFVLNLNLQKLSTTIRNCLAEISDLCLGVYLISYIFDSCYYKILNTRVTEVPLRLNYFPLMVIAVLISSLVGSWIVNRIYISIKLILARIRNKTTT